MYYGEFENRELGTKTLNRYGLEFIYRTYQISLMAVYNDLLVL